MNYPETLEYLFGRLAMFSRTGSDAYKPGLGSTLRLSEEFGLPHRAFPAIHVAGTNGKGSVSSLIAAVLRSAGYRVGLYTSPHLVDFRERIRVDGEMIPEDRVVDFVDRFLRSPLAAELSPSFFEFTTVMAFEHFAREKVDVAVVEVGLGGRLDSTNILTDKLLSIVTNISLDHTALLGHNEEEIAVEKAGIFSQGVPALIGRPGSEGVRSVLLEQAELRGANPIVVASDKHQYRRAVRLQDTLNFYGTPFGTVKSALTGDCQKENGNTVLTALELLRPRLPKISEDAVKEGFLNVVTLSGLMGRWMPLPAKDGVRAVCDTGHNIGGWRLLGPRLKAIAEAASTGTLRMVVGFVNDKDVSAIIREMPIDAEYYFVEPSIARRRPAVETAQIAAAAGRAARRVFEGTDAVRRAYAVALRESAPGDFIFVGGSTFVVADLLSSLNC